MKALTQDRYGTADVVTFRDIERPSPLRGRCWSASSLPA